LYDEILILCTICLNQERGETSTKTYLGHIHLVFCQFRLLVAKNNLTGIYTSPPCIESAGAWIFEDLGCSAYLGAQSLISDPDYRKVAGQIGNTEAYHSSLLRTELYKMLDFAPAYGKTIRQVRSNIELREK